ncbi:HNH endonuclease [Nocardia sp. NPDC005745]|uniref:HNH endonuclease n=1 Tax=Actinomycetes TaxID=1760 RepID=UPI00340F76C7
MNESLCRHIVTERCGGQCERCRAPGVTMHHRWKRGQGGPWTPSNVIALCGSGTTGCHGWVEHNPAAAHESGLWLFNGEHDTQRQRVWLRSPWTLLDRWVWLDDIGGLAETAPVRAESPTSP